MRKEKVLQFGEGGFLRGFADWMIQKMNDNGDTEISIVVVQPIKDGMCDMLEKQNCKYTHVIRGVEGVEKTLVDSISRCVKPYDDYSKYLELAKNPDFKYVISNTTESGITYNEADKDLGAVPADNGVHTSFPAKVCALLYKRFEEGLPGFVFLPCELIDKNGKVLKEIILRYASDWNLSEEFKTWVEKENTFCNTLVDRINTGYPKGEDMELGYEDNMVNTSEYFHLWVIEGDKEKLKELPFEKSGLNVIICDNMEMYRTRKVRILNGAHTSLVPYALLEGFDTVKSCIDDEKMLAHIKSCVFDEIVPTLDLPHDELITYANSVIERFANPYIKHYLSSIALNSVSKFKVRVLPSILEYIKRYNKMPKTLLFSFAKLIAFYKTDMTNDDQDVVKFMKTASVREILSNEKLWDQNLEFLTEEVEKYL